MTSYPQRLARQAGGIVAAVIVLGSIAEDFAKDWVVDTVGAGLGAVGVVVAIAALALGYLAYCAVS